ncbi:MAG: CHASE2 domain-containing protein, partial [Candidatus Aenigmarchaeota archaeon]|nr:CHASE2 domain-containing protein [Candidatus Aenigmarchaeota archaeon]
MKFSKKQMLLLIFIIISSALSLLHLAGAFSVQSLRASDALYAPAPAMEDITIFAIDDSSIQRIGRWPWDRAVYAQALEKLQGAKVVGIDISFFEPSGSDDKLQNALESFESAVLVAEEVPAGDFSQILKPVFIMDNIGHANVFVDEDGVTREIPAEISNGEERIEAFSIKIAEAYSGEDYDFGASTLLVNFAEPFSAYSFSDIFDNENIPNIVENKIIFIGATAPDLHDFRITPVTESMPGVELHANAVQTLLTGAFLERQSAESVIAAIFILSLLVALSLYLFRALFATIITAVAGAGYLFFSFNAFYSGTVMNIFYPLLS